MFVVDQVATTKGTKLSLLEIQSMKNVSKWLLLWLEAITAGCYSGANKLMDKNGACSLQEKISSSFSM